jgi:hypothetical protein
MCVLQGGDGEYIRRSKDTTTTDEAFNIDAGFTSALCTLARRILPLAHHHDIICAFVQRTCVCVCVHLSSYTQDVHQAHDMVHV